ncbi:polysaccharide lyase family 7 protein [Winogradskyella sp. PG-2]|uniref:polysaccharide lyase family 7 protein n=1 Tax=Winogradskyella sp. PG-2 TaxID=754409 RepID=UPI0004589464|nr:alginate lyase [Winogradskyella sp. PG-2]
MKKIVITIATLIAIVACKDNSKTISDKTTQSEAAIKYPRDVVPFMDEWRILLGDGSRIDSLLNFQKHDFFYVKNDGNTEWVVHKTPNTGITSKTSSNTRTELGQIEHWIPEVGGKLTGTLKVKHVSTTGDATKASSYSVVVG